MSTTEITAVRSIRTTRTGKSVATVTVTFPDGTTTSFGGKRAAAASAIVVAEVAERDYSGEWQPERPIIGWNFGFLMARSDSAAAQREAARCATVTSFRNVRAIPVTG